MFTFLYENLFKQHTLCVALKKGSPPPRIISQLTFVTKYFHHMSLLAFLESWALVMGWFLTGLQGSAVAEFSKTKKIYANEK